MAGLGRSDGYAASLVVAERAGETVECQSKSYQSREVTGRRRRPGASASRGRNAGGGRARIAPQTCRALAAIGHEQRVRVLVKLLEGPATYQALQKVTKLKAGPLYHHVNQLRLSGLIMPKQRDLYELTRGGRNLVLGAIVLGPLIRDRRRRPQPSACAGG